MVGTRDEILAALAHHLAEAGHAIKRGPTTIDIAPLRRRDHRMRLSVPPPSDAGQGGQWGAHRGVGEDRAWPGAG